MLLGGDGKATCGSKAPYLHQKHVQTSACDRTKPSRDTSELSQDTDQIHDQQRAVSHERFSNCSEHGRISWTHYCCSIYTRESENLTILDIRECKSNSFFIREDPRECPRIRESLGLSDSRVESPRILGSENVNRTASLSQLAANVYSNGLWAHTLHQAISVKMIVFLSQTVEGVKHQEGFNRGQTIDLSSKCVHNISSRSFYYRSTLTWNQSVVKTLPTVHDKQLCTSTRSYQTLYFK